MPEPRVRSSAAIIGRGVAALSSARILAQAGWDVELCGAPARPVPVLLLGNPTVELLGLIWGELDLHGHALRGRVVCWGVGPSVEVPDGGLVVDGAALVAKLERCCRARAMVEIPSHTADRWVVQARGRAAQAGTRRLGRRVVLNTRVEMRPGTDQELGCMETVDEGWLFLIPAGDGKAVLQAMVPAPPPDPLLVLERMVGCAREVGARVARLATDEIAVISAAPQATDPLTSPGHIAVGDAARAFDPLAGDGTGQGLRAAVLAGAVLESIADGMAERDALDHYAHRVQLAFLRHLAHCVRFYGDAFGPSPAWRAELTPMRDELGHPANRALAARSFAHRLVDGRLKPLHHVAA